MKNQNQTIDLEPVSRALIDLWTTELDIRQRTGWHDSWELQSLRTQDLAALRPLSPQDRLEEIMIRGVRHPGMTREDALYLLSEDPLTAFRLAKKIMGLSGVTS